MKIKQGDREIGRALVYLMLLNASWALKPNGHTSRTLKFTGSRSPDLPV
jgi:hypothetical protein